MPYINAEEKILSSPLINLENLKPSFEEVEEIYSNNTSNDKIKSKIKLIPSNLNTAKFIGLDKITAKTSEITLTLGEVKKYGPLEIKVLKCGKINVKNIEDNVAYLQVKDIKNNQNEKVFIFNGWTFSSDPSLTPFDHAIYDLQLISCNKV
jgi:hypothetical protein